MRVKNAHWHQTAIIYQIYPRSFFDAKGTGIGNLQGIIDKLDYLAGKKESLGVTAIWISPIYTSPMADFGYDVADYCDVDPAFGTVEDVQTLISEAHKRNIKVVLDFVPNHSSDEHPWFIESRTSLDNPKRNWYVWRKPKSDGSPPNNWLSNAGGSAWEWSEQTQRYYLHSFLAKQPDLNWDNPEVREAMKSAMRFWLNFGVDGFRVDAVDWLSKDWRLRDDPRIPVSQNENPPYNSLRHLYSRDGPHLFDRLNEMTDVLKEYEDRFMITEAHPESDDKIQGYLRYYKSVNSQLSAPFNFESIYLPWDASVFRDFVNTFQASMEPGYTPIYTIGNHDESRIASRVGVSAARTAAMMLLTLPGLPFIYYGDELGMTNGRITKQQVRDPFAARSIGRDPQRTPMQWDDSSHAGFTKGTPWLPVGSDYRQVNVDAELHDTTSLLSLYRQLIHFRNQSIILQLGAYYSINTPKDIFGYERSHDGQKLRILLNFSDTAKQVIIPDPQGTIALSTYLDTVGLTTKGQITLRPNEGLLLWVVHD